MAFLDNAGLARFWQHILARLGNKVDVEEGKGLSTNDFTNIYKNRVSFTLIAENTNLDTLKTEGVYGVKTAAISDTLINNPLKNANSGLILEVFDIDGLILQRATGSANKGVYIRVYNSTWSAWRNIEVNTDLYTDLAEHFLPLSGGTLTGDLTVSATVTANKVIGAVYM